MPEIKCYHGCSMSISTDQWVATLTFDQMRHACEQMGKKIKAVEKSTKRTVWRVCRDGICEANYREEDYEKAPDHMVRIYKERLMSEAASWIDKPYSSVNFERNLPHITPERVNQVEYDTEWFPVKA